MSCNNTYIKTNPEIAVAGHNKFGYPSCCDEFFAAATGADTRIHGEWENFGFIPCEACTAEIGVIGYDAYIKAHVIPFRTHHIPFPGNAPLESEIDSVLDYIRAAGGNEADAMDFIRQETEEAWQAAAKYSHRFYSS